VSAVEHRRVGRGKCSCGEEAPLGTDIHRWWDVHLLGERPEGCRSVHCLGIECMNECESSHRLAMFAARCAAAEGVPVDSVRAVELQPEPLAVDPGWAAVDQLLDAIQIRCREGDKRSDWLPVIDRLATEARERLRKMVP